MVDIDWERCDPSAGPSARSGSAVCPYEGTDDSFILFGGGGNTIYYNDAWRFDVSRGEWSRLRVTGDLPLERAYHTAVATSRGVLIYGGWRGSQFLSDAYLLTAADGTGSYTWRKQAFVGSGPGGRAYHTASLVGGTKMFVFGGWLTSFLSDVALLDTTTWQWSTVECKGPRPEPRAAHSATVVDHRIVVFGGESAAGRLNDLQIFDTHTLSWSSPWVQNPACAPTPRSGHSATPMQVGGRPFILFFGGWDGKNHLGDIGILDVEAMAWLDMTSQNALLEGRPRPSVRSGHACIVNGHTDRGIIFGGWSHEAFLDDVWIVSFGSKPGRSVNDRGGRANGEAPNEGGARKPIARARMSRLLDACGSDVLDEFEEWGEILGGRMGGAGDPSEARDGLWRLMLKTVDRAFERGLAVSAPTCDQASPSTSSGITHALHREIKERELLSELVSLRELLSQEVGKLQEYSHGVNAMCPDINVQPLFEHYNCLEVLQEDLTRMLESTDHAHSDQHFGQAVAARDACIETCLGVSHEIESRLEGLVSKQDERTNHINHVISHLEKAVGHVRDEFNVLRHAPNDGTGAHGKALGEGRANGSDERAESNQGSLPEFLLTRDSVSALAQPLHQFSVWAQEHASCVQRTTHAFALALSAAESEEASLDSDVIDAGMRLGRDLTASAGEFLTHLKFECSGADQDHTRQILRDCRMVSDKIRMMVHEQEAIREMKRRFVHVSKQLVATKMENIRLNAEVELIKLRNVESSHLLSIQEYLWSTQNKVKALEAEKGGIEQQLIRLSQHHPEAILISEGEEVAGDENASARQGEAKGAGAGPGAAHRNPKILRSGLVIKGRSFSDYEQVKVLHGHGAKRHVFLVRLRSNPEGGLKVLKEIILEDERCRKDFENEVSMLRKLPHPNIIRIEGVIYEGLRAYIQMPYIAGGTLGDWAKRKPELWELQCAFRQIFQSLAFLHDKNVVHRDIKLENVLMTTHNVPIIVDFGISRVTKHSALNSTDEPANLSTTSTITLEGGRVIKGTEGYMAPEVLAGETVTPAADVWAAGVMLYRAFKLSQGCIEDVRNVDFLKMTLDEGVPKELGDLLDAIFTETAERRITSNGALVSKFVSSTYVNRTREALRILESDKRIDMTRALLRKAKGGNGSDRGNGVPKPMPQRFINDAIRNGLLETVPPKCAPPSGLTFLPSRAKTSKGDLDRFFALGRAMAAAIVDGAEIPPVLAPSVYKYLLNASKGGTLVDLELFDYSEALKLREAMAKTNKRPEALMREVRHVLVDQRQRQLEALRKGFMHGTTHALEKDLDLLSCTDLMVLFCGTQQLRTHYVLSALKFYPEDWPSGNTSTARDLQEIILQMSPNDLRRLLRFATGQCSIVSEQGTGRARLNRSVNLTVFRRSPSSGLPVGRPCLRHIDLPDYNDREILRTKLYQALALLD